MAGLFDTSTVQMATTSQGVLSEAELIQADLQNLLGRLEALTGQWIGDGNTAFTSAKLRYQDANTRLNQALTTIGGLIQTNANRYTTDDANAQSTLTSASSGFDVPGF